MATDAVNLLPEPRSRRQLGDEGLLVLWRDGSEPGRRQGLACVLSMCPNPGCACQLVYVDGFIFDESATAVSCDEDGLHVAMHAGETPLRVTLVEEMIAIVDPDSGETRGHPDLLEAHDPALVDWLGSEMDEESAPPCGNPSPRRCAPPRCATPRCPAGTPRALAGPA